jgi:drug/metabolite transporter (DMT)-like permease
MTVVSGVTYSFYAGILIFISLNIVLLKNGIEKTIAIYKDNFKIILIAGFITGLAHIFFINSVKHTAIANTVIIMSSAPLFTTLFAYLFYKEKVKKNIFIASFFIFVGLLIIFSQQLSNGHLLGDMLALLCTMSFSLTFVVLSKHKDVNRFAVLAFAGLCITIMSSFLIESYTVDKISLYFLLIAGLIVSPFSKVLVLIGTKVLSASEVALLTILETILAPIWAFLFLNEIPIMSTILGGMIILFTLIINTLYLLKTSKEKKKKHLLFMLNSEQ